MKMDGVLRACRGILKVLLFGALVAWVAAAPVVWIVRDTQFLQWMSLQRGKRPLFKGMLYLAVFYACSWAVLSGFSAFRDADRTPFTAFLLPTPIYYLDQTTWSLRPAIWGAAFVTQWLLVILFIFLQQRTIAELAHPSGTESTSVPAVAVS